jgi:hypothetical protein
MQKCFMQKCFMQKCLILCLAQSTVSFDRLSLRNHEEFVREHTTPEFN